MKLCTLGIPGFADFGTFVYRVRVQYWCPILIDIRWCAIIIFIACRCLMIRTHSFLRHFGISVWSLSAEYWRLFRSRHAWSPSKTSPKPSLPCHGTWQGATQVCFQQPQLCIHVACPQGLYEKEIFELHSPKTSLLSCTRGLHNQGEGG